MKCENKKEENANVKDPVIEFVKSRRINPPHHITLRDVAVELTALVKELEDRIKKLEARK